MFLPNNIVLYWQNSYARKCLLFLNRLGSIFFAPSINKYQIFGSSKFINFSSSIYLSLDSWDKNLSFAIKVFWIFIILSASFSLKMPMGNFGNEEIFLKLDDIFLIGLVVLATLKMRYWKSTPLDLPLVIFVLVCIFSIFIGILINTVAHPTLGILYLLKIIEYFLLFYLMVNLMSRRDAWFYLTVILVSAFLIAGYGITEHFLPYPHHPFNYPFFYRIYERGFFYHDASHFGAYLMFMASIVFGLFVYAGKYFFRKIGLLIFFLFLCLPLFWTYSRASYLALLISLLAISGLKSKKILIITLLLFITFVYLFASGPIIERIYSIKAAFLSSKPYSSSIAYRIQQFKYAWETIKQYPLLGIGLSSRERVFYENQFIMFISEIGILGFIAFLSIVFTILRVASSLYKTARDNRIKGLAAGYIGGLLGLLVECNTLVVFLVSRVMIPFWITTAILFWLYDKQKSELCAT